MQQLQVNLTIPIPEGYVLITKVEFEELQQEKQSGRYWTMEDLEERTGRKQLWLKANLLYATRFKKELEKIVHYPNSQGDKWSFHASKMTKFLDDNFCLIFGSSK
jgi:phage pi2 protein 07